MMGGLMETASWKAKCLFRLCEASRFFASRAQTRGAVSLFKCAPSNRNNLLLFHTCRDGARTGLNHYPILSSP